MTWRNAPAPEGYTLGSATEHRHDGLVIALRVYFGRGCWHWRAESRGSVIRGGRAATEELAQQSAERFARPAKSGPKATQGTLL